MNPLHLALQLIRILHNYLKGEKLKHANTKFMLEWERGEEEKEGDSTLNHSQILSQHSTVMWAWPSLYLSLCTKCRRSCCPQRRSGLSSSFYILWSTLLHPAPQLFKRRRTHKQKLEMTHVRKPSSCYVARDQNQGISLTGVKGRIYF